MRHWQRASFGYVDCAYPGDWTVPELAVNSTGCELQTSGPAFKTIDDMIDSAIDRWQPSQIT